MLQIKCHASHLEEEIFQLILISGRYGGGEDFVETISVGNQESAVGAAW